MRGYPLGHVGLPHPTAHARGPVRQTSEDRDRNENHGQPGRQPQGRQSNGDCARPHPRPPRTTQREPPFYCFEEVMDTWLLNAAHMEGLPGRKTDVREAANTHSWTKPRTIARRVHPARERNVLCLRQGDFRECVAVRGLGRRRIEEIDWTAATPQTPRRIARQPALRRRTSEFSIHHHRGAWPTELSRPPSTSGRWLARSSPGPAEQRVSGALCQA